MASTEFMLKTEVDYLCFCYTPRMSQHKELRKMKKFRFQLLAEWLTASHKACKAADVGGGKGLLAWLLNQEGWRFTIIDPVAATKAPQYRDPKTGKQVQLTLDELASIEKIKSPFSERLAEDFDLLIGLHAHGSNMMIINAAAKYHTHFVLLPCCVIDEPIERKPGINWLDSLEAYATQKGNKVRRFELNFKGQNIGICNF